MVEETGADILTGDGRRGFGWMALLLVEPSFSDEELLVSLSSLRCRVAFDFPFFLFLSVTLSGYNK